MMRIVFDTNWRGNRERVKRLLWLVNHERTVAFDEGERNNNGGFLTDQELRQTSYSSRYRREKLSDAMAENLGATSDHVMNAGCAPLRAIVSA